MSRNANVSIIEQFTRMIDLVPKMHFWNKHIQLTAILFFIYEYCVHSRP